MTEGQQLAKASRVLLICPRFFDYQQRIAALVEAAGFSVVVLNDRPSEKSAYKAALRLMPSVTTLVTHARMQRHIAPAIQGPFDHILVVKGEAMSRLILLHLRDLCPRARFSLYLWDAVRNNRNSAETSSLYDAVATFDPSDAIKYAWSYRPLFSDIVAEKPIAKIYDWSFVGTLHSDRIEVLTKLQAALSKQSRFVYGYYASNVMATLGSIKRTIFRRLQAVPTSTCPMSAEQFNAVIRQSKAVVDIEHPQQSGMTMRTIETILSARKLITTNAKIRDSELYHPTRVCVIDRNDPKVPTSFFESEFEPVPQSVVEAYSGECWLRQVLGLSSSTNGNI